MGRGFKGGSKGRGGNAKSGGGSTGGSAGGSSSGGGSDRGERGGSGGRKSGGGNESSGGKSSGKRKGRDIKNARSLADVLGGNKSRPTGGSSSGGSPQGSRGGANQNEDRRHSFNREPGSSAGSPSDNAAPKKLQYIMTFNPPEERGWAEKNSAPREPVRVKAEVSRPQPNPLNTHASKKVSPAREKFLTKQKEQPARSERSTKSNRPERSSKPDRSGRGTSRSEIPARPSSSTGRGAKADALRVTGFIKRHPDGFGFLIPDQPDTPDVYVARQSMTGIMTNDKVEVELYRPRSGGKNKEDRLSGEITKVISRANSRVVGRYLPVDKKYGILQDENKGWGADLRIAADDSMGAKEGELIAVEITQYPDDKHEFTGKVVSVIGDSEDPVNDVIRVVHMSGIPMEFSKEAIADAQKFGGKVTDQERKGREDLTDLNLITIDGVTAKDFDDAIYTEQTSSGFRLVVAIADVSHYVKPGSELDQDAYERGTSTYFPNFVVPMLPEELSNELCSLKPHVIRLCFCCEMNIGFEGQIQDYRFFEGVMDSKARVTYGEAQEVIDAHAKGEERSNTAAVKLAHVSENILRSADLAKILMQKRFRDGSLDLEIPETQVVVDSTGESTDIIRASRLFAHRLIEELMLVTNICTARFMDDAQIPGIYRVHEEPNADKIKDLQRFLWNMGGAKSNMSGGGLAKKLTAALESMAGKPEAQILNILTLRTMQQAHYSETNVGHFGLGFSHYSHFTSPIRRYPDLIAHRIIKSQLYDKYSNMEMTEDDVATSTTWLSATEQRSTKAERKVISIKKARFIRRFIDQEFEGMISSVAKFGVFVLLRQYDVDGLVKIENLGQDRFEYDEENLRLVGRRSGLQYSIGDIVKVKVMGADTDTGKVDFELTEFPEAKEREVGDVVDDRESGPSRGKRGEKGKRKDKPEDPRKEPKKGRRRPQSEKRGESSNDRGGVRKKRISKRRGKN